VRTIIRAGVLSTVAAVMLAAQKPGPDCCRITVEPLGSPTVLNVVVTNLQDAPITLFDSSPENDLKLQVRDEAGKEPERTEYGRKLLTRERKAFRNINRELAKGQSFSQSIDLRRICVLKPATYRVAVTRMVIVGETDVTLTAEAKITIPETSGEQGPGRLSYRCSESDFSARSPTMGSL